MIATAVSEIARNIVRFAGNGEVVIELLDDPRPGVRVVARDTGPGIADVERALADGYSTYNGLGMGLPGARRLMDEFTLVSELGPRHHGDHDQMAKGRMTMMNEDINRHDVDVRGLSRRSTARTRSSCCRNWSPTCASTAPGFGRSGRAGSRTRTCWRR